MPGPKQDRRVVLSRYWFTLLLSGAFNPTLTYSSLGSIMTKCGEKTQRHSFESTAISSLFSSFLLCIYIHTGSIFQGPYLPRKHQPGFEDTQCTLPMHCLRAGSDHDLDSFGGNICWNAAIHSTLWWLNKEFTNEKMGIWMEWTTGNLRSCCGKWPILFDCLAK